MPLFCWFPVPRDSRSALARSPRRRNTQTSPQQPRPHPWRSPSPAHSRPVQCGLVWELLTPGRDKKTDQLKSQTSTLSWGRKNEIQNLQLMTQSRICCDKQLEKQHNQNYKPNTVHSLCLWSTQVMLGPGFHLSMVRHSKFQLSQLKFHRYL